MKTLSCFMIVLAIISMGCKSQIKDTEAKIEIEEGTEVIPEKNTSKIQELNSPENENDTLGFWVGYFREDNKEDYSDKGVYVGEGFYWDRENKINISIDKITDSVVLGHSVVAGNYRPFNGIVKNGLFQVEEPGDDPYDGIFTFQILNDKLTGNWSAYKNIEIKNRKYSLEKMNFSYNPDIMLEEVQAYMDWNKFTEKKTVEEYEEGEFEEWVSQEFATATDLIYTINASNTLLEKNDVENLKRGDITIIRNTIYARHGYSFKNRPLRVFFDAQSWYIPVHTDIKSDFTDLEKENIQLLLRYEKNALEYYDYFGRG